MMNGDELRPLLMQATVRKDLAKLRACLAASPDDDFSIFHAGSPASTFDMCVNLALRHAWPEGVWAMLRHGNPERMPIKRSRALALMTHIGEPWALALAEAVLDLGADFERRDEVGRTLLHRATEDGNMGMMMILGRHGANPDSLCPRGISPLGRAARNNAAEQVDLLLGLGADPNFLNAHGTSALMRAADLVRTDSLARLIAAGADVDQENEAGTTALLIAIEAGCEPAATLLMDAGADPRRKNKHGASPLSAALGQSNVGSARLAIQRAAALDELEALGMAAPARSRASPPRPAL